MYKTILLFIFSLITQLAFPQQYYRSNKLGMELAKIDKYRTDEFEYYLEKISDGNKEIKILYKESAPVWETEIYYSNNGNIDKEIITEDETKTERTYSGKLLYSEKIIDTNDNSGYIKIYKYNSNLLLDTVDELSLEGKLQNSVSYERDIKGRIVSVVRSIYLEDNKKAEDQTSKYRFQGQNLLEEWHGSSDLSGDFIYYNLDGRLLAIVKTDKGKTISEKRYFYDNDLNLRIEEFVESTGAKIIQNITPDGYLIEESVSIGENLVSKTNNYYDDDNKLIRKVNVTKKGVERYLYEYSDDGELSSEKIYLNGEIYKEKVYIEDNAYYEDMYNNGQKYMRIYYKDNEKTKTENGK